MDDIQMYVAGLERAIAEIDSVIENVFSADGVSSTFEDDIRAEAAETCKEWIEAIIASIEDGACDLEIEIH